MNVGILTVVKAMEVVTSLSVVKRSEGLTSNASHRYKNSPRTIKLTEKTPHNVVVCTRSKIYTRETRKGVIEKSLSMNAQVYE